MRASTYTYKTLSTQTSPAQTETRRYESVNLYIQNTIHSDNPSTQQRPGAMRASTYTYKTLSTQTSPAQNRDQAL